MLCIMSSIVLDFGNKKLSQAGALLSHYSISNKKDKYLNEWLQKSTYFQSLERHKGSKKQLCLTG